MTAERSADRPVGFRLDQNFDNQVSSVIDGQAEELRQLLVLLVDEISWLLPTVVLQLGVSTQREEVPGRDNTVLSKSGPN